MKSNFANIQRVMRCIFNTTEIQEFELTHKKGLVKNIRRNLAIISKFQQIKRTE